MSKRKTPDLIKGTATHRRTEQDYLSALLDSVTLDDWRDVVTNTLQAAKDGDPQARAWLAQYLMGKPETKAPTPLTVVVNQLSGGDALVDKLAQPHLNRVRYPSLHQDDDFEDGVKALVAEELAHKIAQTG
ncbi:hypothetical protein Thiowin_00474 [Thiorhodovibrio winogradskyi]|uniref:Uncharacterized protein n=1 Tax=Thiorhodovibrio winogradskyi TaxID=77007 RepID=A0ABZ0S4J1_9GAMM|nr:hypothetical protein [Thiorhodovibrio winogradskyi]